jgi:hypothetical protein
LQSQRVKVVGREFAAILRPMSAYIKIMRSLSGKLHHNLMAAQKHLGFATVRSSVINREPQTMQFM